jgi:exopolysaccharide biosynthesis polyprenyl glycosylphosphotransferase
MNAYSRNTRNTVSTVAPALHREVSVLDETSFHRIIGSERKRTERSRRPFAVMLLTADGRVPKDRNANMLKAVLSVLPSVTRETDLVGWYSAGSIIGVLFTEMGGAESSTISSNLKSRVETELRRTLSADMLEGLRTSVHVYPDEWKYRLSARPSDPVLYPDISRQDEGRRIFAAAKRVMDICGSLAAIVLFAPIAIAIAFAIKLTSKGPILFRQQRVGQHGRPFTFLKFRSMYVNNDVKVHVEWFNKFLSGQGERYSTGRNGKSVFKMPNDPRITRVGRFLRRTSLDELPQFLNVLRGEMSLVGPRPPIPYEVDAYQTWHRARVLAVKPGITGLWQVNGRSRVTFDEMVRLDIRYARTCSLWLDIKILCQTPRAVFFGDGAF